MDGRISNPNGAYATGTATIDGVDREIMEVLTTSALTVGDVVCWTTQATNTQPVVHISVQGTDDPASVAGVAVEVCAANRVAKICRGGPALVNIAAGTVAAWERCILLAGTPGAADGVAADATTIVGDNWGVFLGAEISTTNQAVADIRIG